MTEKTVTIYVNSRPHPWLKANFSYYEVAEIYKQDQPQPPQPITT